MLSGAPCTGWSISLLAPVRPKDKTFDELAAVLTAYFEPKPNVIAEHFRFHQRSQHQGDSVAEYVAEFRRLASRCSFGDYLEEALCDRIACGVRQRIKSCFQKKASL